MQKCMNRSGFKYAILFTIMLSVIASCTKVIDLKLGNDTGKLVIEGNITNKQGVQIVKLSRNVSLNNDNTYPPVTGATVNLSDDKGRNYEFTEETPGTYTISSMAAAAETTYKLLVIVDGKKYTASSVMPKRVELDSVTVSNIEYNPNSKSKLITAHYKDPEGEANQYRFVMYVNKVQVKSVFALDDEFTDGRYVSVDLRENDIDIFPRDTVTLEMQCIDKPIYTYWFTLLQQQANNPGGGVTPANPPTNISPATLGYFSVHTTQHITIVVK